MAVTLAQPDIYTCDKPDCEQEFTSVGAVDGSYCSKRCSLEHTGEKQLRNIKYDHRWCHGCFRKTKEVEAPPAGYPEFVVGFQYLTEHARKGEREGNQDLFVEEDGDDPARDRAPGPADTLTMTGTICECGTTDHRDDWLRAEEIASVDEAVARFCRAVEWMGHEGQHDMIIDAEVLRETLEKSKEIKGEYFWELAVGRAIEA